MWNLENKVGEEFEKDINQKQAEVHRTMKSDSFKDALKVILKVIALL